MSKSIRIRAYAWPYPKHREFEDNLRRGLTPLLLGTVPAALRSMIASISIQQVADTIKQ